MSWMRSKSGQSDPVTLEDHYRRAADVEVYGNSGICRHLPYLRSLVQAYDIVVELGTGGADQSTLAWLAGQPAMLHCYDVNKPTAWDKVQRLTDESFTSVFFHQGLTADQLPEPSDILFIDTLHDCTTVEIELARFAPLCRRQIVFHDVVAFGRVGQFSPPNTGINLAIAEFLFEHPEWRVERYSREDNGLLTLKRCDLIGIASSHGVPLAEGRA